MSSFRASARLVVGCVRRRDGGVKRSRAEKDADLVAFFRKCKTALRDPAKGLILVKENLCSEEDGPRAVFDESDSSLTRCVRWFALMDPAC